MSLRKPITRLPRYNANSRLRHHAWACTSFQVVKWQSRLPVSIVLEALTQEAKKQKGQPELSYPIILPLEVLIVKV